MNNPRRQPGVEQPNAF